MSRKKKGRYAMLRGTWWRDPDLMSCSLAAGGLHAACMSYCADNGTDGFLPYNTILALSRGNSEVVRELVDRGLLATVEEGYELPGWKAHNVTTEQLEEARRRDAERKRRTRAESCPDSVRSDVHPDVLADSLDTRTQDPKEEDPRAREGDLTGPEIHQAFYAQLPEHLPGVKPTHGMDGSAWAMVWERVAAYVNDGCRQLRVTPAEILPWVLWRAWVDSYLKKKHFQPALVERNLSRFFQEALDAYDEAHAA